MYRPSSHSLLRSAQSIVRTRPPPSRRFLSTAPPHHQSRSWKSSALRWGVAITGIYYYNTHPMFWDPASRTIKLDADTDAGIEATLPTVESYSAARKQQDRSLAAPIPAEPDSVGPNDPAALEEEADSQGAFNPATGEINWDCPCLGGMAHGPCGEEFRAAFSCFVYSEQEPKGLDCIDKFQGMQTCFRAHPEVYAAELEDDEELEAEIARERKAMENDVSSAGRLTQPQRRLLDDDPPTQLPISPILSADAPPSKREPTSQPAAGGASSNPTSEPNNAPSHLELGANDSTTSSPKKFDQELDHMPKEWHDASAANEELTGDEQSK